MEKWVIFSCFCNVTQNDFFDNILLMNKLLGYNVCERACSAASVVSNSVRPHELEPTRILYPCDSPGKNPGVGGHSLLQEIFPTQRSSPRLSHLLHWQVGSVPLAPPPGKLKFEFNPLIWIFIANENSYTDLKKKTLELTLISANF